MSPIQLSRPWPEIRDSQRSEMGAHKSRRILTAHAPQYRITVSNNLVPRVRVALANGTGNGDLWDSPFQLEFSLVDLLSMSSRTRSQKVNKNGGKNSSEWVFKLLLSVVNQIFCS